MQLSSTLIKDVMPEPSTLARLQEICTAAAGKRILLMVFEVRYGAKKVYCCLSGGHIDAGVAKMTLVGRAAYEALCNLPVESSTLPIFCELVDNEASLHRAIEESIKRAPDSSKLCFVGDFQGKLHGRVLEALRLSGDTICLLN